MWGAGTFEVMMTPTLTANSHHCPTFGLQRLIVAKVDELMRLCDALEAALVRGEEVTVRLLEAVVHENCEPKPVDI